MPGRATGEIGGKRIFAVGAEPHAAPSDGLGMFFSHHQKQVVIDEQIAFVGGMDVAYGRRNSATYPLDAHGRHGNDSYNGCLPHLLKVQASDYVNCKLVNEPDSRPDDAGDPMPNEAALQAKAALQRGLVAYPDGGVEIDPSRQPRMPWQDVHLKIQGPAVSDLASNFVLRWNTQRGKAELRLPDLSDNYPKAGSCCVQMLRSASPAMVERELKTAAPEDRSRVHAAFGHNHIHHAMVRQIEHAEHFIYIENQFFVSAFGEEGFGDGSTGKPPRSEEVESVVGALKRTVTRELPGNPDASPRNRICEALGAKLQDIILDIGNPPPDGATSNFHVYITLPVHPEGELNDPSIITQVHFTMQSLVLGSQSLVNRVRRAIKARWLFDQGDENCDRAFENENREYEQVPIGHCWPYLTLLNLRNWAQLGDRYVTEQIYVHSKIMIVDDRYAIVGSANINDRSLMGNRDSELAVLVMDTDHTYEDIGLQAGVTLTRKFARQLRMGVWNKLLGNTGGMNPAGLDDAIKRPAAQSSWQKIRALAQENSTFYESSFPFIPSNGKPIWPNSAVQGRTRDTGQMPFDETFWQSPVHKPAASQMSGVLGYITLLPWLWTKGQNNNSGMHSAIFTKNDVQDFRNQEDTQSTRNDSLGDAAERSA